jgi:hypothetical protein
MLHCVQHDIVKVPTLPDAAFGMTRLRLSRLRMLHWVEHDFVKPPLECHPGTQLNQRGQVVDVSPKLAGGCKDERTISIARSGLKGFESAAVAPSSCMACSAL